MFQMEILSHYTVSQNSEHFSKAVDYITPGSSLSLSVLAVTDLLNHDSAPRALLGTSALMFVVDERAFETTEVCDLNEGLAD